MSEFLVETKQLTKVYGEQTVVSSVNLHVKKRPYLRSAWPQRSRQNYDNENDFGINPHYFG